MNVWGHNLRETFSSNKLWKVTSIEMGDSDMWVARGSYEGLDFEIPITPAHFKNLVVAAFERSEEVEKEKSKSERSKEQRKAEEEKAAKREEEAHKKAMEIALAPPPPPPPAPKPTPTISVPFSPPTKMCPDKTNRQKLSGDALALFKKFETLQVQVLAKVGRKRRNEAEQKEADIARSYALASDSNPENMKTLLSWNKHMERTING